MTDPAVPTPFALLLRQTLAAELGMSIDALAARVGVARSTVYRHVAGTVTPSPEHLRAYADALGLDVRALEEIIELRPADEREAATFARYARLASLDALGHLQFCDNARYLVLRRIHALSGLAALPDDADLAGGDVLDAVMDQIRELVEFDADNMAFRERLVRAKVAPRPAPRGGGPPDPTYPKGGTPPEGGGTEDSRDR